MGRAVTAIAVNPLAHFELAVATQDSTIHIYDRRMLGTKAHGKCTSNLISWNDSNIYLSWIKFSSIKFNKWLSLIYYYLNN